MTVVGIKSQLQIILDGRETNHTNSCILSMVEIMKKVWPPDTQERTKSSHVAIQREIEKAKL
mgnify:CR=1 FL=1